MSTTTNNYGVYNRLGFNSSDQITSSNVQPYSSNVITQMSLMNNKPLLNSPWQFQELANGIPQLFVNPVASVASSIWAKSNTLISLNTGLTSSTPGVITALSNVFTQAGIISSNTANNFLYVTNRESNVVPPGTDVNTPHYTKAISQAQTLSYIMYQSDGISNNSIIMGNFTSITLANTLTPLYSTMANLTSILSASISGGGGDPPTYSTSISLANAQSLQATVYTINQIMQKYPAQDKQFFMNSANVLSDFSTLSQFNSMGQSQKQLIGNYIGSSTLVKNLGLTSS
jgi:hypothetical protein